MSRNYTAAEFADAVDYEGGVYDALEYGMRADDIADQDSDLAKAWRDVEEQHAIMAPLVTLVGMHLDAAREAAYA